MGSSARQSSAASAAAFSKTNAPPEPPLPAPTRGTRVETADAHGTTPLAVCQIPEEAGRRVTGHTRVPCQTPRSPGTWPTKSEGPVRGAKGGLCIVYAFAISPDFEGCGGSSGCGRVIQRLGFRPL